MTTIQFEEYCLQFFHLPGDFKAYEIYPQLMGQIKANILAIYMGVSQQNEISSSKCYHLLEEYLIQTNQHLVRKAIKREARHFHVHPESLLKDYEDDPASYGIMRNDKTFTSKKATKGPEEQKTDPLTMPKMLENIISASKQETAAQSSSPIVLFFDASQKIQEIQIKDIVLFQRMTENKQIPAPELYVKRLFQSRKNLYFKGFYSGFDTFDACLLQNGQEGQGLFRQYWDLQNVENYIPSSKAEFKKIYFHERFPQNGSLAALLHLDLVFQIEKILELRVSFSFQFIEAYHFENKVCWLVFLTTHPECYFYPLKQNEYLAFHIKNWRRVPNFLLGSMPDNIDRLYLNGNRNVIRIIFNKDSYTQKHSQFFQAYEKKLIELGRLKHIKRSKSLTMPTIPFYDQQQSTHLKLNSERINQAKVPFEIKFLLMVMISKCQIDVYTLPENFLEKIWDFSSTTNNDKIKPYMAKSAIEMFVFNSDFDKTYLTYEKFKQEYNKNLQLVRNKEKILGVFLAEEKELTSFDANLFNFELQITPSCVYYLCSDFGISKTILFKFYHHIERFLLVKFVDENLQIMKTVRNIIGKFYYHKFLSKVKVFDREYDFLSFNSSQVESRSFWTFSSTKETKAETILKFLESQNLPQSSLFSNHFNNVMSYVKRVSDQIRYSYDTLELANGKTTSIPFVNEILEDISPDALHKNYTAEGFISSDLLQEISDKFNYGNLPGIVLRTQGKEFLLLKNPDETQKKSLQFYQNLCQAYHLETITHYDIVEIPRYRSAFLSNRLILLLESYFITKFPEEYPELVRGIQSVLQQHIQKFDSGDVDLFNSISFSSRNANNALQPILSSYQYFPREAYFQNLFHSIFDRSLSDILKKMKIHTKFGAYILGIVDPKGVLAEDEVYYDIDNPLEQPLFKENLFPHVLVARKPCLDSHEKLNQYDAQDLKIFKINTLLASLSNNPFNGLKNCIIFSQKDKNFVLNSRSSLGSVSRASYFLVLWDQNFIPEKFRKVLPPSDKNPKKENSIHRNKLGDNSISYYFEKETSKLSEYLDQKAYEDGNQSQMSHEEFKAKKDKIQSKFLALIGNPRMKDIKALHLAYSDSSRVKCGDKTARLLSKSYREFNVFGPSKAFSDEQIYNLLNILESSRYLPVPFYNKNTRSIHPLQSQSFLGVIYKVITEWQACSKPKQDLTTQISIDQNLIYQGYESHLKNALKILILYKYDIQKLCFLYGCSKESDLFTGFNRKENYPSQDLELPSFQTEFINLKDYLRLLTKKYRKLFGENLSYIILPNGEVKVDPAKKSEVLSKASAWYLCSLYPLWTQNENLNKYLNDPNLKPLFTILNSFTLTKVYGLPWIAANDLLEEIQLLQK